MNQLIKFKWDEKDNLYFSSDFHYNHKCETWEVPLWKVRGYDSVEHANESQINQINKSVPENATLFYTGDTALNADEDIVLDLWSRINCKDIRFIYGNHDLIMYRLYKQELKKQYGLEGVELYPLKMNNVTYLGNYAEIQVGKKKITLCHYPIRSWNQAGRGSINLHGHSHNNDPTRNPDYHLGKCLDLSWDWKKDVWTFDQIMDVMSTKEIHVTDHHDVGVR